MYLAFTGSHFLDYYLIVKFPRPLVLGVELRAGNFIFELFKIPRMRGKIVI